VGDGLVVREVLGHVAWLRLNRAEAMNALSARMLEALNTELDAVESDAAVRVVVLTGTGPAFCAGADLKGITAPDGSIDPAAVVAFVRGAGATIDRLPALRKPVIAAVNGLALAGGLELVLACDLVIAAQSAKLGDAHANYGLLPGAGGAARLARVVGPRVAKYLAFTGEFLPAADLVPFGLVNEVVPDDQLEHRASQLAERLASKSPLGLAHMKQLIDDGLEQPLDTALRLEHLAMATHAHSADMQEGLAAFREKRTPRYAGR
jgi:enoyl-CoA hydratase